MGPIFIYFLKANGLLITFYLAYHFLLRKETFFQGNRWFLLFGIISSLILPLITFTEIIWIDPQPVVYDTINSLQEGTLSPNTEEATVNWSMLLISIYMMISFLFLTKVFFEVASFFKIIRNGTQIKKEKIVFVETNMNHNPFSFFNYLVVNRTNFTEAELNIIMIHEKVHITQKHSIDVLIGKILCLIFWANPFAWIYRKAMLENLEFIADSETSKITDNVYQYQKTLLKAVVCNNQLSITNQFYQSLIKKRIVMLNKNQSHKMNIWKYSVVAPLLVAFMLFFQVKVEAQTKIIEKKLEKNDVERVEFIIDKNTTEKEISEETSILKEKHQVALKVSKVKRNSDKEITGLKIEYKGKNGTSGTTQVSSDKPIEPIVFYLENKNGNTSMGLVQNPKTPRKPLVIHSKRDDDNQVIVWNSDDENEFDIDIDGDEINKFVQIKMDSLMTNHNFAFSSNDNINFKTPKIKIFKTKKDGKVTVERIDNGDKEVYFISEDNEEELADQTRRIIEVQERAMEKASREMERAKTQMNFEWKEKHEKKERAEIEKMRAELEKAKEEILKAKEEILKAKKEIELSRKNSKK